MLVSQDSTVHSISNAVMTEVVELALYPMPSFASLYPTGESGALEEIEGLPNRYVEDELALVLHSSGTTRLF